MLILTPTPLETAAERAFFAELAGWETGGSVRGGVMASLPLVEGPMQRRQADAVLFVPEGLALVRVVEVVRQSGVVSAVADGAWTIGPGAGPGDVLQLAGGGSSPLEGLMRAGMDAAVRLRRAGLEPGRIARLTVLTGALTGLLPADGDLGDGDQVALLDPRSLLLGVARASRYAGTDNPRLWTTADVRAGIEALGVTGRSPAVEELNGEGFPYSPYVLRRRELIEPMNLPSARGAAIPQSNAGPTVAAAVPSPEEALVRRGAAGPLVDPAAAGRVAAAAVQAQEAAEARDAVEAAPTTSRDTRALPPEQPVAAPAVEPTVVEATVVESNAAPAPLPVEEPGPAPEDTGGLGGLFGGPAPARQDAAETWGTSQIQASPPQNGTPPGATSVFAGSGGWDGNWAAASAPPVPPAPAATGRRRRVAVLLALALAAVLIVGVGGWLLQRDDDGGGTSPAASTGGAGGPRDDAPAAGDTVQVDGVIYTMQAARVDGSCRTHSYGAVADYFATADCAGLSRALWSAHVDGASAVVSLSRVEMPDAAGAKALRALADGNGTGNVADLLREGVTYAGAPDELSAAEYASALRGATVTIVETAWSSSKEGSSDALDMLASNALTLPAAHAAAGK